MSLITSGRSISGCATICVKVKRTQGGIEHEEGVAKAAIYPGTNVAMCNDFDQQGRNVYQAGSTDYAGTGTNVTTTKNPMWIVKEDPLQGFTVASQFPAGETT
jgi:hypothetical protein